MSIAGCVLTDAELDHTAGLLFLREGDSFSIFGTMTVRRWLNRYLPLEPLLACFAKPSWMDLPLNQSVRLTDKDNTSAGLLMRAFEVQRHVPRFVSEEVASATGSVIGLQIEDRNTGGKLVYAPCVGSLMEPLLSMAKEADAVLVDGTFWSDDEPLRCGIGQRTATQMGHVPVSGLAGSLSWLSKLPARHRMYIHINNTNPMLNERGPEFRLVNEQGVRVGADGDEFVL
jgi:pyrroloquinoline quinone biosynthesis protein B